jgi:ferredoxin
VIALRRAAQGVALAVFLTLLFWVSWPHSARPARTWSGWMPVEVEAATGQVTLAADRPQADVPAAGSVVHVIDTAAPGAKPLDTFRIVRSGAQELALSPRAPLSKEQRERIAESIGPWTLFESRPDAWPSHFADDLATKELIPAETFLLLDPLAGVATGVASRQWTSAATWAITVLLACLVVPRLFCGYVCPLGTLIDLFDGSIGRVLRLRRPRFPGWLRGVRFAILAIVLGAAASGVLLTGFVSAIPLLTRGLCSSLGALQNAALRGSHVVPPLAWAELASVGLVLAVLALGLLRRRFWCRYLCPSGAILSLGSVFSVFRRRVATHCSDCGRCVENCPFGAAESAEAFFAAAECGSCRTCAAVCPQQAVEYPIAWKRPPASDASQPEQGRRAFLSTAVSAAVAGLGTAVACGAAKALGESAGAGSLPLRPPGSLAEPEFRRRCIRCGACLRACPSGVLQAMGFAGGAETLWTPQLVPDWSGCEPSCNRCGQVCPTGAIRPLTLDEKRNTPIGLAAIDPGACLPHAGRGDCRLCAEACAGIGYGAIEFVQVRTAVDAAGNPLEDSGYTAPRVIADRCVGCALCQNRCHAINVVQKGLLTTSAVTIQPCRPERNVR